MAYSNFFRGNYDSGYLTIHMYIYYLCTGYIALVPYKHWRVTPHC